MNRRNIYTSMIRIKIPDLLVFKPTFMPDHVPIPFPVLPSLTFEDESSIYFGDSKTLRTPAHQKMVMKFVRDQYPKARFQRIYDAATDGWKANDFHR